VADSTRSSEPSNGIALVISLPVALVTAVYLNEVGGRLAQPVRFVIDAMSGIPSIVAGLFIFAVWIAGTEGGEGYSGFAASMALSIIMLPTICRTALEMLRLVPDGLREAALALGAPRWSVTWRIVLPTARSGLVTAVILGVARAVGETAPVLLTAFGTSGLNWNPLAGAQDNLPLFVWKQINSFKDAQQERAWVGAFVLIVLVLAAFTAARWLGNRNRRTR
jgi:phosphate transport system permease protein